MTKRIANVVLLSTVLFSSWSLAQESALDVEQPEGWDDELKLAEPVDLNPDPNILEFEMEARVTEMEILEGFTTPVWSYGGTLPGPLIKAKIGDKVIIHFKNSLPEPTSIHWHGVRVPNNMDGVPGITQDMIPPGGEFTYEFDLPDAGTFWYHPHSNSVSQLGWGLYGAIMVEDPDDPDVFGEDLVLVIADISLRENGDFIPPDNGGGFSDLFGREGTYILVNGKLMPNLKVRAGKQQRWRVINASRSRYVPLALRGHMLTRIGGDNGLAAESEQVPRIILTPGERADIVFTPSSEPGTKADMRLGSVNRGFGTGITVPVPIMTIETVDLPPVTPEEIPVKLRDIEPFDISNAIEKTLEMTIELGGEREVTMGFNNIPYWEMAPLVARVGETHVWTIVNNSDFNHPFHLHGFFFQVLDDDRVLELKDTVDVAVGETIRIAVHFEGRPGMWMYHCHILDHAKVGMMGQIWVAPEDYEGPVPEMMMMDH